MINPLRGSVDISLLRDSKSSLQECNKLVLRV